MRKYFWVLLSAEGFSTKRMFSGRKVSEGNFPGGISQGGGVNGISWYDSKNSQKLDDSSESKEQY